MVFHQKQEAEKRIFQVRFLHFVSHSFSKPPYFCYCLTDVLSSSEGGNDFPILPLSPIQHVCERVHMRMHTHTSFPITPNSPKITCKFFLQKKDEMVISLSQLLFLLIENVLSLFIKRNDNIVDHSIFKVYLGVPMCLKFMTLSFGCLLNCKYIIMGVEFSLSSHNT